MIAIKGKKIPKNCVECHNLGLQWALGCQFIYSGCANCGRHPDCPLVEIVTCKDCKYWKDNGIITTCEKNIGNGFPRDYFCASGKRKE